jgi:1,2-diacylglycerol 3-alpha-glucosyltransferase
VGEGPSEQQIRTIFRAKGLAKKLIMPGKKCGQALFDAYAAMDVFAFSSQSETQGMVIAEAMAAGLPVVALNASGVREVVQNGKNGFLLDAKASEEEFAACLGKIKTKPKLREQLKAGAQRTAQKFSKERSAKKALEFYEEIRKQTRRQRHIEKEELWANLVKRIEVEWKLISDKAQCAINALTSDGKKDETPREEAALV